MATWGQHASLCVSLFVRCVPFFCLSCTVHSTHIRYVIELDLFVLLVCFICLLVVLLLLLTLLPSRWKFFFVLFCFFLFLLSCHFMSALPCTLFVQHIVHSSLASAGPVRNRCWADQSHLIGTDWQTHTHTDDRPIDDPFCSLIFRVTAAPAHYVGVVPH